MSKSLQSSVIPPEVQKLFAQLYGEITASAQAETTSEQVKQLQGELEGVKAELKGIIFAFNESQKQVMTLAQENEKLKQGDNSTQGKKQSAATKPLPEKPPKAKQKSSAKQASKPKPAPKKASTKAAKTKQQSNSSISDQEGWKVGTKRMQSDLTKTKILTRSQTDKVKKTGAEVIGKDGSVWKFTGRRRDRNNAKIYERIS